MPTSENRQPASLEEAVEMLIESNKDQIEQIKSQSKGEFIGRQHFTAGMNLRNGWNLWFNDPGDKLAEWFSSHNLNHGDDRSGAIMEAFYCKINGQEFDLETYKNRIFKHWSKYSQYPDGVLPVPGPRPIR